MNDAVLLASELNPQHADFIAVTKPTKALL